MQIPVLAKLLSLFCLSVPGLLAAPRFILTARRLPDHTLLTPVRVNGAGPFACTFDSGGSRTLSLNAAIEAKAGTKTFQTTCRIPIRPFVVIVKAGS